MNKSLLVNYIRQIILLEQNLVKYNFLISALENSNKSDLLDNINQSEVESQISKLKKYQFQWLINYINSDIVEDVDFPEIIETILEFDKKKNSFNKDKAGKSKNKDIAAYKSIEEIKLVLGPSNRDLAKQEREKNLSESEIVYKDKKITIYFPHSEEASCEIGNRMGSGSVKWCTAADKSKNEFYIYTLRKRINLYYILSNLTTGTNLDKIAVGVKNNEIIYGEEVTQTADGIDIDDPEELEEHFGERYWNKIKNIITNFDKKYVNAHPAINYTKNIKYIAANIKDKSIQLELAESADNDVRYYLASNPNLDKEVQLILVEKGNSQVRWALAENPSIDKEVQLILVEKGDNRVRNYLAENPNLDEEIGLILANDEEDPFIRYYLADNPKFEKHKEIQLILAEKGDDSARIILARNGNIDKEIQLILAEKGSDRVRKALRKNPNLDPEIKRMLENE